jgi:chromosome segregation ATPase
MLMAVMMNPRETWTDQRLDDLNKKVGEGFAKVDESFKQVDERFRQVDQRFDRVEGDMRELRGEMNELKREMNGRFDSLNRTLIIATAGGNAAIITALIGLNAF